MNWDSVSKELQKPLSPDAVRQPPQGKFGEYVDALHVIREANRIFGENGWNYSTDQLTQTNNEQNGDRYRVGYFALVTVNVDGVSRSDVGHGQGFGRSLGDAHDSAVKEAVTDALKRSLRTFGNTFGLALYEKNKELREVGYSSDIPDEVTESIKSATTAEALKTIWESQTDWQEDPIFRDAINKRKSELMKEAA